MERREEERKKQHVEARMITSRKHPFPSPIDRFQVHQLS